MEILNVYFYWLAFVQISDVCSDSWLGRKEPIKAELSAMWSHKKIFGAGSLAYAKLKVWMACVIHRLRHFDIVTIQVPLWLNCSFQLIRHLLSKTVCIHSAMLLFGQLDGSKPNLLPTFHVRNANNILISPSATMQDKVMLVAGKIRNLSLKKL